MANRTLETKLLAPRTIQRLVAPIFALSVFVWGPGTPITAASSGTPVALDSTQKIHPLLQSGAQLDPTALVRVIVQKSKPDTKSDSLVAKVPGAKISEEFGVIPAFVATLPQSEIVLLANNPGVRYVSPDGPVDVIPGKAPKTSNAAANPKSPKPQPQSRQGLDASQLLTTYPAGTGASSAWSALDGHVETGSGISIAVIDSGVDASHPDLSGHVVAVNVNRSSPTGGDGYGHGTHVAGIIAGHDPSGQYLGIAPNATLISVKVSDDNGAAYVSDLLRGLDWIAANQDAYRIRAVNVSASVSVAESYGTSPVDAAVEHLWNDGVAVVTSAGNLGSAQDAVWFAPGNDPRVITVGCLDDNLTVAPDDDSLCSISSHGLTEDGFAKPDLVAPGRKIVSTLSTGVNRQGASLAAEFSDRVSTDGRHLRLSGTSMSAPMVTGAIALLLDRHPTLAPDQLKQLLTSTSRSYPGQPDGAGALNITEALVASDHAQADVRQVPLPVVGIDPPARVSTVVWDGARWTAAYWDGARWTGDYWDGARWTSTFWDGARWTSAFWDGARWTAAYWDGARWTGGRWDGARWTDSTSWNSSANFN